MAMNNALNRQSPIAWAVTLVRSAIFALLFYSFTVVMLLVSAVSNLFGHRAIVRAVQFWAWGHRVMIRVVLGQRIVIEGTLPAEAPFVVLKHESMFETLDVVCLFGDPVIAAKRELAEIPVWGPVAQAYGLVPVDREAGARALRAIRAAARDAMAKGRTVIFFPEGTRVAHGTEPPLKSGFAGIYSMLRVGVLPIAVDSGRLSPRNGFLKRPGVITYRIGEFVPPGLPRDEAEARVHAAINALNRRDAPVAASDTDSV
jgi:1-acyl-sn-glycerol-3-phosphate acyltransferase